MRKEQLPCLHFCTHAFCLEIYNKFFTILMFCIEKKNDVLIDVLNWWWCIWMKKKLGAFSPKKLEIVSNMHVCVRVWWAVTSVSHSFTVDFLTLCLVHISRIFPIKQLTWQGFYTHLFCKLVNYMGKKSTSVQYNKRQ
jgi:hypothetical protein